MWLPLGSLAGFSGLGRLGLRGENGGREMGGLGGRKRKGGREN